VSGGGEAPRDVSDAGAAAVFDADVRRALACLLDLVIPRSRDGRMPGAGELGIAAQIERVAQRDAGLKAAVSAGIAELEAEALRRGSDGFVALSAAERQAALKEVATAQPGFLPGLVFHTYVAYYQDGRALAGLGLAPQPPFPKGHALEPFDEALLEPARRRGKLYRDA
jgi:hypothetical protein